MREIKEKEPRETELLETLASLEDLAEKKTKIYSRLLTETSLAQDMETLSARHAARKQLLEKLAFGKTEKEKNGQGMSAANGGKKEK
ncbi:MAG: hypothetical protein IJV83_01620 [Clostridia bacterium]|nr:hypothetical protein [Clostridia bacterium]